MALKAGKNGRIYLSGYDLSGKVNRFSIALPRDFEDVTCLGDSGRKWYPLLHNNSFGFDAFYDPATKVHIANDAANTVAAATATDQGTLETLLNEIKGDYNAHRVGTAYHDNADAVNVVSAEDATDLPTATALANEIKTDYNAHRIQANIHPENDEFFNHVVSADADNLATCLTLANEEKASYNNHLSGTVKRIIEIMNILRSTSGIASLCLGAAQGDKAIAGHGVFQQDYPIEMPVEGMLKITGDFVFSDMALAGYILQIKETKTSNGSGTKVDDGAASKLGCETYLQVFACGADDALIVKVQDDDDVAFGSPHDLITFTTANGVTSERKITTAKSGTADATEANKLHDADGGFVAGDVGKTVWNTTDDTYTTVSGFVDAGELTLADNIMANGENYTLGAVRRYVRVTWAGTSPYSATFAVVFCRK